MKHTKEEALAIALEIFADDLKGCKIRNSPPVAWDIDPSGDSYAAINWPGWPFPEVLKSDCWPELAHKVAFRIEARIKKKTADFPSS